MSRLKILKKIPSLEVDGDSYHDTFLRYLPRAGNEKGYNLYCSICSLVVKHAGASDLDGSDFYPPGLGCLTCSSYDHNSVHMLA